jgi:protein-S-isoprenylcysteine O-methyltransferase Ste14
MTNPILVLLRVPVPWVFVLAYLIGVGLEFVRPTILFLKAPQLTTSVGAMLFTAGAIIAGWGLVLFRKAHTTTVPGRVSARLVNYGPYQFTRNPMYVGLTLAYLGEAGLLKQIWPLAILPFVLAYLNWIVIPLEETRLIQVFGMEYDRYRAQVRRWV